MPKGRPRKPNGRAQGHRKQRVITLAPEENPAPVSAAPEPEKSNLPAKVVPIHPAPKDLLKETEEAWADFWLSPVSSLVDWSRDRHALQRLFWLYDERTRLARAGRKARLVAGSQGQLILNPLLRQLTATDSEIRQLEDRFGLNPKAAVALGLELGALQKTMEDLNKEANGPSGRRPATETEAGEVVAVEDAEPDPRAVLIGTVRR